MRSQVLKMDAGSRLLELRALRLTPSITSEISSIKINFGWESINDIVSDTCSGQGPLKDREKSMIHYLHIRLPAEDQRGFTYNKPKATHSFVLLSSHLPILSEPL